VREQCERERVGEGAHICHTSVRSKRLEDGQFFSLLFFTDSKKDLQGLLVDKSTRKRPEAVIEL
jgi:hypothetical protein